MGFVAQSSMRSDFLLPLMELRYDNGSGDAKCGEGDRQVAGYFPSGYAFV